MMVPAAEDVLLFFGTGDDNSVFRIGPRLSGAATLSLVAGDPFQDGMLQQVTRRVSVPPLQMKDFSGDSHPDLLISRGNVLLQYIANEQGALPSSPTATVDLALFEAKLSSIKFDPGNLAALAQFQIQESWVDLNLDGADDLLVLFGGTLVVYRGGPQGIDLRRPMDQIPTRGNVLGAFALPVDADEIPDLVLLRVEEISLGRVLSWLLLDVSVDFDLLVYRGRGNCRFDKRPLPQSRTIEIQAPSLLVLANRKEELDEKRRGVVRLADFDGDGKKTDLVVLDHQGKLEGYSKVASKVRMSNMADDFLLQLLAKDAPETLDLEMLSRWILGKTSLLESLSQGNRPVFSLDPPKGWQLPHLLAVADFDGDGAEECLVLRRKDQRFVGYQYDPQLGGIPK